MSTGKRWALLQVTPIRGILILHPYKANNITFLLPETSDCRALKFSRMVSLFLWALKVTNGMADVIPNTASSNAWVGEDYVGSFWWEFREQVWEMRLLGEVRKEDYMVLILKEHRELLWLVRQYLEIMGIKEIFCICTKHIIWEIKNTNKKEERISSLLRSSYIILIELKWRKIKGLWRIDLKNYEVVCRVWILGIRVMNICWWKQSCLVASRGLPADRLDFQF